MKRRSMLGRRQSRQLQSPTAASSAFKPPAFCTRNAQRTPEQTNERERDYNPFKTPSTNGSLSEVGASGDPWSVFKCVRNGLKSPDMSVHRNPQDDFLKPRSALRENYNRRKELKLAEKMGTLNTTSSAKPTSKFAYTVYKHQRKTLGFSPSDTSQGGQPLNGIPKPDLNNHLPARSDSDEGRTTRLNCASAQAAKPFNFSSYSNLMKKDALSAGTKTNGGLYSKTPDIVEGTVEQRQLGSKSPWSCDDLRNLSPPWSNGLNTLNDFNLLTPQLPSRATGGPAVTESKPVDLSNSLACPLEVTVVDTTVIQTKVTPPAMESSANTDHKEEKLDLKSALSNVSLGVDSLELLDKHGVGSWKPTSCATRSPLRELPEEPGDSEELDKENVPFNQDSDEQSQTSDQTFLSPSQGSSSNSTKNTKNYLERLVELNHRIEEAEEERNSAEEKIIKLEEQIRLAIDERRAAEEKRRTLENERKMINYELLEEMSRAPSIFGEQAKKRRKLGFSSAKKEPKKGPSLLASKLLKRDFARTPVRTPRRSLANRTLSINQSVLNPFTPKTLRKNINDQYDMIFGN